MRIFVFLFVTVLLAVTSFQLWMTQDNATPEQVVNETMGQSEVQIGGPFTLTDQHGNMVNDGDFRGKVMLVFFGFTHCPDICPVTVSNLSKAMELLGEQADSVVPIFITVDPKRDTPEAMSAFLANFDKRIVGLTGTQEEISKLEAAYKAYAARTDVAVPEGHEEGHEGDEDHHDDANGGHDDGDYMMDHSAYIYLMDKNGTYSKIFSSTTPAEELARAVQHSLE